MALTLPADIDARVETLPAAIRERVARDFPQRERIDVCRKLAAYGVESHETGGSEVLDAILDQARGNAEAVESLVVVAKQDWRNLFYSSRSDPGRLIDKLLKNLRFTKVFDDEQVTAAQRQRGFSSDCQIFEAVLQTIQDSNAQITLEQQARITQIGELLGFPKQQFDWLLKYVRDQDQQPTSKSRRAWWRFW